MPDGQPGAGNPKISSLKRKHPVGSAGQSTQSRKRVKIQDARFIAAQTSGKAFGNGELDVNKFVKSREFEITAIEDSLMRTKRALNTRAFQSVPRELRRRSASHNVKRVPKRLRRKAAREMAEDNTPTVNSRNRKLSSRMRLRMDTVKRLKELTASSHRSFNRREPPKLSGTPRIKPNSLQKPPAPKSRYKKRQRYKLWLPTHVYHAKRARMTPPKEPLWKMAIPISPNMKSYRPSHRASQDHGALAWDMSYMSTIGLEGNRLAILSMLRRLGVGRGQGDAFGTESSPWARGRRAWCGWLYDHDTLTGVAVVPATIVWCSNDSTDGTAPACTKRKALVRIHPSAFLQVWQAMINAAAVQQPRVLVEDLRFEIGSIEVVGPATMEALVGVLSPVTDSESGSTSRTTLWKMLANVTNPGIVPANVVLGLNVSDPRLHEPVRRASTVEAGAQNALLQSLAQWPLDREQQGVLDSLFHRSARLEASRRLLSQTTIDRRKKLAGPGKTVEMRPTDPEIPVLLLAPQKDMGVPGGWTVLLPWKCVTTIWHALMKYPLSTGGNVRFGGLNETRQIHFEACTPWFPGDYPGTTAGITWEEENRAKRKAEWDKKPKGKRIEWDSVNLGPGRKGELGLGWACDWSLLSSSQPLHYTSASAWQKLFLENDEHAKKALLPVRLCMVGRGVVQECARIYRLPTQDVELRQQWLQLAKPKQGGKRTLQLQRRTTAPADAPIHVQRQMLAASILREAVGGEQSRGGMHAPAPPGEEDLIGFVTTGNFDLRSGRGAAIGSVLLSLALEPGDRLQLPTKQLCIVRNSGQSQGWLAEWHGLGECAGRNSVPPRASRR